MNGLEQDTALLRDLVRHAGVTATEVAKKAKLAPSTINRPYNGSAETRLSQRTLEKLQTAYPDFPGWRSMAKSVAVVREDSVPYDHGAATTSPLDGTIEIPMLELAYGMGGSFLDSDDGAAAIESFPIAFIRMFTRAPASQLAFAHGIGDSMEPTIGDRDLLLIDRSLDAIRMNDQIWALVTGGIGMVKRVRVEGGNIWLLSDNQSVPDYQVAEDELTVIGRVVAITRRL